MLKLQIFLFFLLIYYQSTITEKYSGFMNYIIYIFSGFNQHMKVIQRKSLNIL